MNNPFQLTFTLKQHTPIIHFQHDQKGATLRATEVKPKLDRFIIQKMGGKANMDKSWFNDYERESLCYKLKIEDLDNRPINQRSFGGFRLITETIDDPATGLPKKAVSSNVLTVTIACLNNELKNTLEIYLPLFFAITNFGNRQNKGWGCYYHENHNDWNNLMNCLKTSGEVVYIHNQNVNTNDFSQFYSSKIIGDVWKPLKSGVNLYNRDGRQTRYIKAHSFKYLGEKQLRWDKRWMKLELNRMIDNRTLPAQLIGNNAPNNIGGNTSNTNKCQNNFFNANNWDNDPEDSFRFVRAMLGLAEHIEFRAQQGYVYQVIIKSDEGIDRFKAPVTFKVFNNKLYAVVNVSDAKMMLNKKFHFAVQKKRRPRNGGAPVSVGNPIPITNNNNQIKTLSTPRNKNEFDIVEFLDNYFGCVGFNRLQ